MLTTIDKIEICKKYNLPVALYRAVISQDNFFENFHKNVSYLYLAYRMTENANVKKMICRSIYLAYEKYNNGNK